MADDKLAIIEKNPEDQKETEEPNGNWYHNKELNFDVWRSQLSAIKDALEKQIVEQKRMLAFHQQMRDEFKKPK